MAEINWPMVREYVAEQKRLGQWGASGIVAAPRQPKLVRAMIADDEAALLDRYRGAAILKAAGYTHFDFGGGVRLIDDCILVPFAMPAAPPACQVQRR